jgi:hypothetical protein
LAFSFSSFFSFSLRAFFSFSVNSFTGAVASACVLELVVCSVIILPEELPVFPKNFRR